jgi:hypothetical protein
MLGLLAREAFLAAIGKSAVPAGVGVDLRAVEPQSAQLQHSHLTRQGCSFRFWPERRDAVVVGMIVSRDETKRHRVIGRPLQHWRHRRQDEVMGSLAESRKAGTAGRPDSQRFRSGLRGNIAITS